VGTVDHLFFTCKVSKRIWELCDRWVGTMSVHYNKPKANFQHFYMLNKIQLESVCS